MTDCVVSSCCCGTPVTIAGLMCRDCGQPTIPKRVTGTCEELLKKYHVMVRNGDEHYTEVCEHCGSPRIQPSTWRCECGNLLEAGDLILKCWEGEEE